MVILTESGDRFTVEATAASSSFRVLTATTGHNSDLEVSIAALQPLKLGGLSVESETAGAYLLWKGLDL